jgi:2-iminobutanoate/2-iminopropanoate deaminase
VGAETSQAVRNAEGALESCGATMDDVVRVDVVLASIEDFRAMNAAYSEAFVAPYPTRTTVGAALVGVARVEITVLAVTESEDRA